MSRVAARSSQKRSLSDMVILQSSGLMLYCAMPNVLLM
jgi:hypothetical protein